MTDKSITKVNAASAPRGAMGQKYLASGTQLAMRLWDSVEPGNDEPGNDEPETLRDYETVGYVIAGRATLHLEGQSVSLEPGDSWTVVPGARHRYEVHEAFTAIEATSPPAHAHGRDE